MNRSEARADALSLAVKYVSEMGGDVITIARLFFDFIWEGN
jgi:hypothetical protein